MPTRSKDECVARALARASWPVRRFRLGDEPGDDLSASTTPEERLAMMETLSREAWVLTGRPFPDYRRDESPVRVVALGRLRA